MGDRTIEIVGSVVYEDLKHFLKAHVSIDTFKETGWMTKTRSGSKTGFEGLIYKCTAPKHKEMVPTEFGIKQKLPDSEKHIKDIDKSLVKITGNWLQLIKFNDVEYWNVDVDQYSYTRQIPLTKMDSASELVMPSDWRYREDLLWLKYGFLPIASDWKHKLEEQQRADRKSR